MTTNQIEQAKEQDLKAIRESVDTLFADGAEKHSFVFRADSFCGSTAEIPKPIYDFFETLKPSTERFLSGMNMFLDDWYRGVISLNKEQAQTLALAVANWNEEWAYRISHDMEDYNAYNIGFGPATGAESKIQVSTGGRHYTDSWQLS